MYTYTGRELKCHQMIFISKCIHTFTIMTVYKIPHIFYKKKWPHKTGHIGYHFTKELIKNNHPKI